MRPSAVEVGVQWFCVLGMGPSGVTWIPRVLVKQGGSIKASCLLPGTDIFRKGQRGPRCQQILEEKDETSSQAAPLWPLPTVRKMFVICL